jgi:hypothetical protein
VVVRRRGPLTLEQVHGSAPGTVDAVVTALRPIPPVAALLFSEAINHLRAALDNVVFHLVTSALGKTREFEAHARGALRNGLTPDQLIAVVRQIMVYAGVPAAVG